MPAADPRDAAALFRRHAAGVGRFLVRRGVPRQDVDDLVQEVFLVAHRLGGYERGAARPFTWLAAIAVRVAAAARRRRRRALEAPPLLAPTPAPTPAAEVEAVETLIRLGAALQELPAGDRELLLQCAIEDRPRGPVAAGLGIPLGTVYVRLHAARRRLANALTAAREDLSPRAARAGAPPARRSSPGRASPG